MSRFRDNIQRPGRPQVCRVMVSKHQTYTLLYIYFEFQIILGNEEYFFCISYSFHKFNYNGILDSKNVLSSTRTYLSPFNIPIV